MDNINHELENNEFGKKQIADNVETDNRSYGAIYSPDPSGNGYNCEKYNAECENSMNKEVFDNCSNPNKYFKFRFAWAMITVALCVICSSAAAFGAVFLIDNYTMNVEESVNTVQGANDDSLGMPNNVYIDQSPDYSEETIVKDTLLSMEDAIRSVKDSVVEITTESLSSGFGGFSQYVVGGAGSGVIISSGGYIITNNHVVDGASNIVVRLTDGSCHKARLIGSDSKSDIAVIAITPPEGTNLISAVIGNSDYLNLGQTVIAIGNPLGELGGTVTDGIISCLAREIVIDGSGTMTLLQTNAAVSPGNSGGGLFDLYGRLIGVVNAKFSGDGVEGISFAIPMNTAWDVAEQLINKGYVSGRPALGVTLSQVQYGYGIWGGTSYQVVVVDPQIVKELKVDDVIIGINNIQISTIGELSDIVSSYSIGDILTLTVLRDRKYIEVKVTLVEYSPSLEENRIGQE